MRTNAINILSPMQAVEAVLLCWRAGYIPNLVGSTGVGKTTIMNDLHAALKAKNASMKLWKVLLGAVAPEDVGGYNAIVDGKLKSLALENLIPFCADDVGILALDELDRSSAECLNAATSLLLDRQIHGHKIGDGIFIITAMNGSTDIHTTQLSQALRARLVHIYISSNGETFYKSFEKFCEKKSITAKLSDFARANKFENVELEDLAHYEPRTLVMAERLYAVGDDTKAKKDIVSACISGVIGSAFGPALVAWLSSELTYEKMLNATQYEMIKRDSRIVLDVVRAHVESTGLTEVSYDETRKLKLALTGEQYQLLKKEDLLNE